MGVWVGVGGLCGVVVSRALGSRVGHQAPGDGWRERERGWRVRIDHMGEIRLGWTRFFEVHIRGYYGGHELHSTLLLSWER